MKFKTIVLIDDCDVDRYLLRRQVKKICSSDSIHEAEHGRQALHMLKELAGADEASEASLILVDINMPIMGGFEFLDEFSTVRADLPFLKNSRVVVMSSSGIEQDRVRALKHEFVLGYLPKGAESPEEFREKIHDLVA